MANGQGPLSNAPGYSPGQNPLIPQGQPSAQSGGQVQPDQDAVKKLLAMLAQQMSQSQAGGQTNVPLPKAPQQKSQTNVEYGGIAGGIMGLIEGHKAKKEALETQKAESYYNQLQQFLTPTGDPNVDAQNKQKAEMFLGDDKIRKTLEKGLGYFQLMEPEKPPPEAVGVHQAMNKGKQKPTAQAQPQRPSLPQGGPMGNMQALLSMLKPLTEAQGNVASTTETISRTSQINQQIDLGSKTTEANIKNLNASTEATKWKLENDKNLSPLEKENLEKDLKTKDAQLSEFNKRAELYSAEASYYRSGKITPQFILSSYRTALAGLDKSASDASTLMKQAQSERDKYQNWQNQYAKQGVISDDILSKLGFTNMGDFTSKLQQADLILNAQKAAYQKAVQGRQNLAQVQTQVVNGSMPLSKAIVDAYKAAGVSIPSDVVNGITADAPPDATALDDEIMNLVK
jgi:hypothetical protein